MSPHEESVHQTLSPLLLQFQELVITRRKCTDRRTKRRKHQMKFDLLAATPCDK